MSIYHFPCNISIVYILLNVNSYLKISYTFIGDVVKYKRIRDLREDMDLSQTKVAEQLDISQRSYSNYENGVSQWTPEMLIKLSKFYNVSVDYLLELTEVEKPYPRTRKEKRFNSNK